MDRATHSIVHASLSSEQAQPDSRSLVFLLARLALRFALLRSSASSAFRFSTASCHLYDTKLPFRWIYFARTCAYQSTIAQVVVVIVFHIFACVKRNIVVDDLTQNGIRDLIGGICLWRRMKGLA